MIKAALAVGACAVLCALTPAAARAADVAPGPGDYVVNVQDDVPIRKDLPTEPVRQDRSEPPAPPLCGSTPAPVCTPVTTCVPYPGSPTGYMLETVFDFSLTSQDFAYSVPCEPSGTSGASFPAAIRRAFERVPLPEPVLSIQPPKGKTLVGLETIFSTEAEPFTRTLQLLGRRMELRIEPSGFAWVHGDGTTQSTDWAGKAWDRDEPEIDGYITHLYERTGTVRPRVAVTWSAEYRVNGGDWQSVDGTVTREGAPAELAVLEGQPVLNSY